MLTFSLQIMIIRPKYKFYIIYILFKSEYTIDNTKLISKPIYINRLWRVPRGSTSNINKGVKKGVDNHDLLSCFQFYELEWR